MSSNSVHVSLKYGIASRNQIHIHQLYIITILTESIFDRTSGLFSQTVNKLKELYDEIIERRKVLKFKTHYIIMNLDTQGCGRSN